MINILLHADIDLELADKFDRTALRWTPAPGKLCLVENVIIAE
jgi:hypothetical protein